MNAHRHWIAFFLGLCGAGCAERPPASLDEPRQMEEELRIGSLDGLEALTAIGIGGVAVSKEGQVFVSQPQEGVIKVFDPDGKYLRIIGARGGGPGEFTSPSALGVLGDTLWVYDGETGRVTYFAPAGSLLRTQSLPPLELGSLLLHRGGLPLRTGHYLAIGFGFRGAPDPTVPIPIVARAANGRVTDTLALIRFPSKGLLQTGEPGGRSLFVVNLPLHDGANFTAMPNGAGLVLSEEIPRAGAYRLIRINAEGDTALDHTIAFPAIPVSAQYIDRTVNQYAALLDSGMPFTAEDIAAELRRFEYFPPVTRLVPGVDSRTWVRREDTGTDSVTWDVIGADGELAFRTSLARMADVRWARGDTVWAVIPDSLDVPYLVKLRAK